MGLSRPSFYRLMNFLVLLSFSFSCRKTLQDIHDTENIDGGKTVLSKISSLPQNINSRKKDKNQSNDEHAHEAAPNLETNSSTSPHSPVEAPRIKLEASDVSMLACGGLLQSIEDEPWWYNFQNNLRKNGPRHLWAHLRHRNLVTGSYEENQKAAALCSSFLLKINRYRQVMDYKELELDSLGLLINTEQTATLLKKQYPVEACIKIVKMIDVSSASELKALKKDLKSKSFKAAGLITDLLAAARSQVTDARGLMIRAKSCIGALETIEDLEKLKSLQDASEDEVLGFFCEFFRILSKIDCDIPCEHAWVTTYECSDPCFLQSPGCHREVENVTISCLRRI